MSSNRSPRGTAEKHIMLSIPGGWAQTMLMQQHQKLDEEKKAWNWKKYVAQHVKYHNILGNLMEYGYQELDPGSKVRYLLNGVRCDKLSTVVVAVRVHSDKYEKDFDAVSAFLTQYIDKRAPTPSVNVPCTPDMPSGRRPTLAMAISKERSS